MGALSASTTPLPPLTEQSSCLSLTRAAFFSGSPPLRDREPPENTRESSYPPFRVWSHHRLSIAIEWNRLIGVTTPRPISNATNLLRVKNTGGSNPPQA